MGQNKSEQMSDLSLLLNEGNKTPMEIYQSVISYHWQNAKNHSHKNK